MVELAELIADLRDELSLAVDAANPDGLRFELGPVGLEVSVMVTKEAKPGAKVKFWVVEVGADASVSKATTQTITLTLQPKMPGGGQAYVTGQTAPGEE